MNEQNLNKSTLKYLEMIELVGITFIRDYIQFLFDGPVLNTYTLPQIKVGNKIITSTDIGYYDTLYRLIGKKIVFTNEKKDRITIKFESDTELFVSLKLEERNCAEAVMLQLEAEGKWNIW